jgi:hypothetical protein
LVDSLALQRELARFDATLTREQIESIIKASSAQKSKFHASMTDPLAAEGDSLESTLLSLRRAFAENVPETLPVSRVPGGFGNILNRQEFYLDLAKLPQTGVAGIVVLAGKSATEIEALAAQESSAGLAVRYALRELNPFAVVGVDYLSRFTNGELDLYRASEDRGLSPKWLKARATFLDALMRYNTVNGDLTAEQIGGYLFAITPHVRPLEALSMIDCDTNRPLRSPDPVAAASFVRQGREGNSYPLEAIPQTRSISGGRR